MRNGWLIIAVAACGGPDDHDHVTADIPRLIAPLSLSTVTQQRPALRWTGFGDATTKVELCQDRACTLPLSIGTQLAADHRSAVPLAALPPGWVFWRVRDAAAAPGGVTATWQFWVGTSSAGNPVDTSSGAILDVNGDGYPDVLVGSQGLGAHAVHLYLGSATPGAAAWNTVPSSARIDLINPDANTQFGYAVASAGDVNGDGYADFLIGSNNEFKLPGAVRLYLGGPAPSAADWNGASPAKRIDLINPSGGADPIGRAIAGAGDVNGDGYADFLVATAAGMEVGAAVYVHLGSAAPSAADWDDVAGTRRLRVRTFAFSMASAGDVNGDGYSDFLVGGATSDIAGAQLYLGSATPRGVDWSASSSTVRIDLNNPDGASSEFGAAVASAGDVNGDGYGDFLVGAPGETTGTSPGAAHLYLGSAAPRSTDWSGTAPVKRVDLVSPDGVLSFFGYAAASAGDVNGDGYADFLIGAFEQPSAGAAHLYLGSATPGAAWNGASPAARIDLANPVSTTSSFGYAVTGAGDVNGDGYPDFVVGARGAAYLHLGMATPSAALWGGSVTSKRIDLSGASFNESGFGDAVARLAIPAKIRSQASQ